MQERLVYRPHIQTPQKIPGCVKKSRLIAA
jgi:hypothetical protein